MPDGAIVSIKFREKVGSRDVKNLVGAMTREGQASGIVVALSFTRDARQEAEDLAQRDISVALVTEKELQAGQAGQAAMVEVATPPAAPASESGSGTAEGAYDDIPDSDPHRLLRRRTIHAMRHQRELTADQATKFAKALKDTEATLDEVDGACRRMALTLADLMVRVTEGKTKAARLAIIEDGLRALTYAARD